MPFLPCTLSSDMKTVAITLFMALCGLASAANPFTRQDPSTCTPSDSFIASAVVTCPELTMDDVTAQDLCNSNCIGKICDYYESNDFPSSCTLSLVELCENAGLSVPSACLTNPCLQISSAFTFKFVSKCPAILDDPAAEDLCNDNCYGRLCNYYTDNDFPTSCVSNVAQNCRFASQSVPADCNPDGALALLTLKGVLATMLLLAAFFIF